MSHRHLRGGCACGRNQYMIIVPEGVTEEAAQVYFDSGRDHRKLPCLACLPSVIDKLTGSLISQVDPSAHHFQSGCEFRWHGINQTHDPIIQTNLTTLSAVHSLLYTLLIASVASAVSAALL